MTTGLASWHALIESKDPVALSDLLADDVVFWSPVIHRPITGPEMVSLYLTGAMHVLGDGFHYVREVVSGNDVVLEFSAQLDDLVVNGVDMIHFNDDGRIDDFKVMLRPLKATLAVKEKMAALLAP